MYTNESTIVTKDGVQGPFRILILLVVIDFINQIPIYLYNFWSSICCASTVCMAEYTLLCLKVSALPGESKVTKHQMIMVCDKYIFTFKISMAYVQFMKVMHSGGDLAENQFKINNNLIKNCQNIMLKVFTS